jgi:uncharacterized protein (TIGR03435 family)
MRSNRARRSVRAALAIGLGIGIVAHAVVRGQSGPSSATPTFDVASIKMNRTGDQRIMFGGPAGTGRFNATNAPLREIIRVAYGLMGFQLIGGPAWLDADRFDIIAKAPEGTPPIAPPGTETPGAMNAMMQNLLVERFSLKTHRETRDMPLYTLVVARADGKLGAKLEPSPVNCAELRRTPGGPPPALMSPPPPGEAPTCGMMMGLNTVAAGGVTMRTLASALAQRVGRTVNDQTHLSGEYRFVLTFTPDLPPGAPIPQINGQAIDMNGPSLFTALQEQLGLKLDSQRGPVDVLVIDSIEHPTED